jgi:hypothetical protein
MILRKARGAKYQVGRIGLRLRAEPSGRAARDQDHSERSALDVVAGGEVGV